MWAVIDKDEILAYHAEERVCAHYLEKYRESINTHSGNLIKVKRKDLPIGYDEKYLVKYGDNYIQYKYLDVAEVDIKPIIESLYSAHDTLQLLMEIRKKKDVKKLMNADKIIMNEIEKIDLSSYDINRLNDRKAEIERYRSEMEGI